MGGEYFGGIYFGEYSGLFNPDFPHVVDTGTGADSISIQRPAFILIGSGYFGGLYFGEYSQEHFLGFSNLDELGVGVDTIDVLKPKIINIYPKVKDQILLNNI